MTDDRDTLLEEKRRRYEEARQAFVEKQNQRELHDEACEKLSPDQLAAHLHSALDIENFSGVNDIAERLEKQSGVLDAVFYTKLHEAGLGFEHSLKDDPTQMALHAQKLCRQTFDSLRSLQADKSCKGKEGVEK